MKNFLSTRVIRAQSWIQDKIQLSELRSSFKQSTTREAKIDKLAKKAGNTEEAKAAATRLVNADASAKSVSFLSRMKERGKALLETLAGQSDAAKARLNRLSHVLRERAAIRSNLAEAKQNYRLERLIGRTSPSEYLRERLGELKTALDTAKESGKGFWKRMFSPSTEAKLARTRSRVIKREFARARLARTLEDALIKRAESLAKGKTNPLVTEQALITARREMSVRLAGFDLGTRMRESLRALLTTGSNMPF